MEVLKRSDREKELSSKGVTGQALAFLLAETALERHQSRVAFARRTAEMWYIHQAEESVSDWELALATQAVLWADVIGLGQKTDRHPAFKECGKGRKQASDGDAWSAAILAAAYQREHCQAMFFPVGGATLAVGVLNDKFIPCTESLVPLPWQLEIAREGLRQAAKITRRDWRIPVLNSPDTLPEWAALVNHLAEAVQAEAQP